MNAMQNISKSAGKVAVAVLVLLSSMTFAQLGHQDNRNDNNDNVVEWHSIVGVITAQGVDNPVSANIHSGTFAWSTRSGHARVNLETGQTSFDVEGLVINGTSFSGTPGPVTQITGTLVCGAGTDQESTHDSDFVTLNARGNVRFSGYLADVPTDCANPLFLLRIAVPQGAAGRWIATGAQRSFGAND